MIRAPWPTDQQLDARVPICFLPVRLETRFGQGDKGPELWVRIYPDQISIDTHQDGLTAQEQADGDAYWAAVQAPGGLPPDEARRRAWRALATAHGATRAAWIVGATDRTSPIYGAATQAAPGDKVPTAEALPDFWTVVGYTGGAEAFRQTWSVAQRPLPVGLDPQGGTFPGDIPVDNKMRWLVDFDEAVKIGMAVRIPITALQQARGFDRIVVYGLRQPSGNETGEQVLETLLDHHHYTDGLSWAPQGAPTKNTSDAASVFNRNDPGFDTSYDVELGKGLLTGVGDGQRSADLLGVYPFMFDHVRFSDRQDLLDADHMNRGLWPATLGYFLTEVMADVFDTGQVDGARKYFLNHVRPRGPISALRVGRTLYGILPVTSITLRRSAATDPGELALIGFLQSAVPVWLRSSAATPHVGRSPDPDKDLAGILGMDASSMAFRSRWVLGDNFTWNFFNFFFGWLSFSSQSPWWREHYRRARALLNSFGYTNWVPKVLSTTLGPSGFLLGYPTVQTGPLSETDPLADDATLTGGTKLNYIRWLRQATVEQIQAESYPGPTPTSLLYRLLRQSLLTEYYNQASRVQVTEGTLDSADALERELVHLGSQRTVTRWDILGRLESKTHRKWSDLLHDVKPGSAYGSLADLFASLDYLAGLPTAELDRLLTETLDAGSHRLDAWITSIATKLLQAVRHTDSPPTARLFIGSYGWIEGLQASPARATVSGPASAAVARLDRAKPITSAKPVREPHQDNGGYILAPSMAQATTAAVLRSGYLTHRQTSNGQLLAVDLSSKRVRTALWIMDAVRQGQPLGAVLGYQFEQGLARAGLNKYQQPFRDKYQLVDNQLTPGQPGETVAASQVVNGAALQKAWKDGALPPGSAWDPTLPQPGQDQDTVIGLLRMLDDLMDALGDLSVAEAVHQITQGNPARAGGILDAMAKGERPPDVQVVNTPRGGLDLTHRVIVLFGDAGQLKAGWSAAHLRAAAEPRLNAWLSQWLPDLAVVKCSVTYTVMGAATTKSVLLSDLDIGPLDFLAMAQTSDAAQAGELEQRILYMKVPTGATDGTVDFALDAVADAGKISFPDAAFAARAWRDLVRGARALLPADLIDPDRASSAANDGQVDMADINQRASDARTALTTAIGALNASVEGPDGAARAALIQASYLGVDGAIPQSVDETGAALTSRVTAVLKQLNQRKGDSDALALPAARPSGALAVIRAVFGQDVIGLPLFSPPDNAKLQQALSNSAALIGPDLDAPARWIQQLTHIRPAVSRFDAAFAATELLNATSRPALSLAQLPYNPGENWIGGKLGAAPPPPGRLSMAVVAAGDYAHSTSYAGLLVDEWPERIPSTSVTAGLTFHYEEPRARAPQTLLLAVCPDQRPAWNDEAVMAILNEALDLAKIRTVDLDSIQDIGQILPALYFPFNEQQETISADILDVRKR